MIRAAIALAALLDAAPPVQGQPALTPGDIASFDCAKASSAVGKEICRTPAGRAADLAMATAYAKALASIPADSRPRLLASQRSFLGSLEPTCRRPGGRRGQLEGECIEIALRVRTDVLDHTVARTDGVDFVRAVNYRALPRRLDPQASRDQPQEVDALTVSLPQIATPRSAADREWNAMIGQRMAKLEAAERFGPGSGSTTLSVNVNLVTQGFIESELVTNFRQSEVRTSSHWSLTLGRELTAADLFSDPARARAAAVRVAFDFARELDPDYVKREGAKLARSIHTDLADLTNWSFTQESASVLIHDVGTQGAVVDIPWKVLRPYLRKNLPFTPDFTQAASPN